MVNTCMVLGCKSSKCKNPDISFFKISQRIRNYCNINNYLQELSEIRTHAWLKAMRRNLKPENCGNWKVCSLHFFSGRPARLEDYDNVDWVPSLNLGYTPSPVKIAPKLLKNLGKRGCRKIYTPEEIANLPILRNYGTQTEIAGGDEDVLMEYDETNDLVITTEGLLLHSVASQTLPTEAEDYRRRKQILTLIEEVKSLNKKIEMLKAENDLLKLAILNDTKINKTKT